MAWRFHALALPTREWVHRDLPLRDVRLSLAVSGPSSLSASIDPDWPELRDPATGEPLLQEWSTLIVAEASGQLRGGGILVSTEAAGSRLALDCQGFSAYPAGQPLVSNLLWGGPTAGVTGNGVDPLAVVRGLWDHLQAQPGGDIGVTYDSTATPYRLGSWYNAAAGSSGEAGDPVPIDRVWGPGDTRPTPARGKTLYWQYALSHYDNVDIGDQIDKLARQAPFDYREHYTWDGPARDDVAMRLEFGYPRLGRRRQDLRFTEGENVRDIITVRRDGADYANVIVARGAGEGSKQLSQTASIPDGRVRRAAAVERADITTASALRAAAEEELLRRTALDDITGFTVDGSHPNAPLGSFAPGDDVLVQTYTGWRRLDMWVRITAVEIEPASDQAVVTCARSESFDYSGGV